MERAFQQKFNIFKEFNAEQMIQFKANLITSIKDYNKELNKSRETEIGIFSNSIRREQELAASLIKPNTVIDITEIKDEEQKAFRRLESEYEKRLTKDKEEMERVLNSKKESIKARYATILKANMHVIALSNNRI